MGARGWSCPVCIPIPHNSACLMSSYTACKKIIDSLDKPSVSQATKAIVQWWIFFWIRHSECGFAHGECRSSNNLDYSVFTGRGCTCGFLCESAVQGSGACENVLCIWINNPWTAFGGKQFQLALLTLYKAAMQSDWNVVGLISLWDCPAGETCFKCI